MIRNLIYSLLWFLCMILSQTTVLAQKTTMPEWSNDRFEQYIGAVIGPNLQDNIDLIGYEWQNDGRSIVEFIIDFLLQRVFSLLLILSITIVVIGCFSFIFSTNEETIKQSINYIMWWIVSIVLVLSITYIIGVLVGGDSGASTWSDSDGLFEQFGRSLWFTDIVYEYDKTRNGVWLAAQLYDRLMFPFIKFASYLLVWVLFLILLSNVFKYLTSGEWEMQKTSLKICLNTILGILLIASAKFIVQFVYWVQEKVLNQKAANLSQIGTQIGATDPNSVANTQLIFNYFNRWLSFLGFVMVILIIINAYKLLFEWDQSEVLTQTRKYFLYLVGWLLLIWFAYMIVNVLLIK